MTSGQAAPTWRPDTSLNPGNIALARAVAQMAGRSGRVLEAGAGTARFLRAICSRFPELKGHACDTAIWGLAYAKQADGQLAVTRADLTALPYQSETFDAVVVFDVLEHLRQPELAVREMARVMRPGGLFHALVPCEGQPATLHWLMWKVGVAADLKEKRLGHVQRFTHGALRGLLEGEGFRVAGASYSMHWIGQVKDIVMHAQEGQGFPQWLARNPVYRVLNTGLWAASYLESRALAPLAACAVAVHVTAVKQ